MSSPMMRPSRSINTVATLTMLSATSPAPCLPAVIATRAASPPTHDRSRRHACSDRAIRSALFRSAWYPLGPIHRPSCALSPPQRRSAPVAMSSGVRESPTIVCQSWRAASCEDSATSLLKTVHRQAPGDAQRQRTSMSGSGQTASVRSPCKRVLGHRQGVVPTVGSCAKGISSSSRIVRNLRACPQSVTRTARPQSRD